MPERRRRSAARANASAAMRSTTSLDVEPGRVEHRPLPAAAAQRAVLARGVALVAQRLLGEHRLVHRRPARRRAGARARAGSAVRNTFSSASGATTVPMSRPSATQSPRAISSRCLATSASRTPGSAATREAASETSRRADRLGHVAAVEQSRASRASSMPRAAAASRRRAPALGSARERQQRDAAIHRAAVQIGEAQLARHRAGDRRLAGARRGRRSRSPSRTASTAAEVPAGRPRWVLTRQPARSSTNPG